MNRICIINTWGQLSPNSNLGTCYHHFFKHIFPQASLHIIDPCSQSLSPHEKNYNLYVIPGSNNSCYEQEDWINKTKEFVKTLYDTKKNVLGICFGHQLIAEALGGKVEKLPSQWHGGHQIYHVNNKQSWMCLAHKKIIKLYAFHHDYVSVTPHKACHFLRNDDFKYAAYAIDRQILCFQSHPEYSREKIKKLLTSQWAITNIDKKSLDEAKVNLNQSTDHVIINSWISNFFNHAF